MSDSINKGKKIDDIKPNKYLLELLVCPIYKTALRYDIKNKELKSVSSMYAYPVFHGVPIMLSSEARPFIGS